MEKIDYSKINYKELEKKRNNSTLAVLNLYSKYMKEDFEKVATEIEQVEFSGNESISDTVEMLDEAIHKCVRDYKRNSNIITIRNYEHSYDSTEDSYKIVGYIFYDASIMDSDYYDVWWYMDVNFELAEKLRDNKNFDPYDFKLRIIERLRTVTENEIYLQLLVKTDEVEKEKFDVLFWKFSKDYFESGCEDEYYDDYEVDDEDEDDDEDESKKENIWEGFELGGTSDSNIVARIEYLNVGDKLNVKLVEPQFREIFDIQDCAFASNKGIVGFITATNCDLNIAIELGMIKVEAVVANLTKLSERSKRCKHAYLYVDLIVEEAKYVSKDRSINSVNKKDILSKNENIEVSSTKSSITKNTPKNISCKKTVDDIKISHIENYIANFKQNWKNEIKISNAEIVNSKATPIARSNDARIKKVRENTQSIIDKYNLELQKNIDNLDNIGEKILNKYPKDEMIVNICQLMEKSFKELHMEISIKIYKESEKFKNTYDSRYAVISKKWKKIAKGFDEKQIVKNTTKNLTSKKTEEKQTEIYNKAYDKNNKSETEKNIEEEKYRELLDWTFDEGKIYKGKEWSIAVPDAYKLEKNDWGEDIIIPKNDYFREDDEDYYESEENICSFRIKRDPNFPQESLEILKNGEVIHPLAREGQVGGTMCLVFKNSFMDTARKISTVSWNKSKSVATILSQQMFDRKINNIFVVNGNNLYGIIASSNYGILDDGKHFEMLINSLKRWLKTMKFVKDNDHYPTLTEFESYECYKEVAEYGHINKIDKAIEQARIECNLAVNGHIQMYVYEKYAEDKGLSTYALHRYKDIMKKCMDVYEFYFEKADEFVKKLVNNKVDTKIISSVIEKLQELNTKPENIVVTGENYKLNSNEQIETTKKIKKIKSNWKKIVNEQYKIIEEERKQQEELEKLKKEEKRKKQKELAGKRNIWTHSEKLKFLKNKRDELIKKRDELDLEIREEKQSGKHSVIVETKKQIVRKHEEELINKNILLRKTNLDFDEIYVKLKSKSFISVLAKNTLREKLYLINASIVSLEDEIIEINNKLVEEKNEIDELIAQEERIKQEKIDEFYVLNEEISYIDEKIEQINNPKEEEESWEDNI